MLKLFMDCVGFVNGIFVDETISVSPAIEVVFDRAAV
jgi:hypothetical protein